MLHASRYFGSSTQAPLPSHSPLSNKCRVLLEYGLRRERSAAWRCGVPLTAHSQPRSSSQLWRADASSPSVTDGTVRLHARSHARGLKLLDISLRSASALPMASPLASLMPTPELPGMQRLIPPRPPPKPFRPILLSALSFGVGSGTARRYLQVSLHKPIRAQHILSTSVAITLIWNGRYSHSGLPHTTANSYPLPSVS